MLLELFVTISLQKINQDNFNERDDYGEPFSEQQYTHGSYYTSLFKYKSFGQSDPPPRIASNFRHLLSWGTIDRGVTCREWGHTLNPQYSFLIKLASLSAIQQGVLFNFVRDCGAATGSFITKLTFYLIVPISKPKK